MTGAAGGIGRAVALQLARDGFSVVVTDLNGATLKRTVSEVRELDVPVLAVPADATVDGHVRRVVDATTDLGDLRALVCSAGLLRRTTAADITLDEWHLVIDANLTSAYLFARTAFPRLSATGSARLVNVASMAGRATSTLGGAHYTAAKAGLLGLTRHLAREWARFGITVNAISPGIVDTGMVRGGTTPEELERVRSSIPAGRLADPQEVAALVGFLISDRAAYITGTNVDIHGGELIIA